MCRRIRIVLFVFSLQQAATALACPDMAQTAWPAATERAADGRPTARFIPPELYTGATWRGERELVLRPVDVTRKPLIPEDHPPISFTGPLPRPGDPALAVLKRSRTSGREGEILQYLAVNDRGDGLGRLSDTRATRGNRVMAECFKFPLGRWQQGETRTCRTSRIRIIEIDFTWQCLPHALKFRWNDEGTYIFAPDRGLVSITHPE